MKRRTSFMFLAAAAGGIFLSSAPAAHAAPLPASEPVAIASGSPPSVVPGVVLAAALTPSLPRVTVVAGDTLWALGIKWHRGWPALASYNRIPNPDLIYVGQIITIPAASYTGSTPVIPSAPVRTQYDYVPAKAQVNTPISHSRTSYVPVQAPASGSFQACVMFRESTNGAGSSNLYGILPSTWSSLGLSGSPYTASRAQQDAAFQQLYAKDGTAPWAPYDGC